MEFWRGTGGAVAGKANSEGRGRGKLLSPERRRGAVRHARESYQVSERHACRLLEESEFELVGELVLRNSTTRYAIGEKWPHSRHNSALKENSHRCRALHSPILGGKSEFSGSK